MQPLRAACAWLAATVPVLAQEPSLDSLPLVLRAGMAAAPPAGSGSPGETILADLPFETSRGYGFVGGLPGRLLTGTAIGGDPRWPVAWREGAEKYVFRLPRGEYLLELWFIETDAASAGHRSFDVLAEDRAIAADFDIAREAGDFAWVSLSARVGVYDGWLDVGFVPRTAAFPPRVSHLRIARWPAAPPAPPAPVLRAAAGPRRVDLRWEGAGAAAGYEVLRASAAAGPFEPVPPGPVRVPWYADVDREPDRELFYRVRAIGLDGGKGPESSTEAVTPISPASPGLPLFDLKVAAEDLKKLGVRSDPPHEVLAELHSFGDVHHVRLSIDQGVGAWRRRKSFRLVPDVERNRTIRKRRAIFFSAEAGDATRLRELVAAGLAEKVGLARPKVEPVLLAINGIVEGLYFDIERLDRRFRVRSQLDRVGVLALQTRGDALREDWTPYGEQRGEEGNIFALTELVHELNRLGDGEAGRFFEDRFYFDRLVDRVALSLLRGSALGERFWLEDSRNRRWELFEAREPDGSLGVFDGEIEPRACTLDGMTAVLEGATVGRSAGTRREPSVLETRLLALPRFRDRLRERLEALAAGPACAAAFDALVDQAFARVRTAALADASAWPADGGAAFLAGAERLKAMHRARLEVAGQFAARLRAPQAPRLALHHLLLRPQEGEPRIEIKNTANAAQSLSGCYITTELHPRALRFHLPAARDLSPGEVFRWRRLPGGTFPTVDPSGGFLALWRQPAASLQPVLLDSVFFGRQTSGIGYARQADGSWAYIAAEAPTGDPPRPLAPPGFEMRQGVSKEKNGDLRIWLRLRNIPERGDKTPQKVTLFYRGEGRDEFQNVDLQWDDKAFHHAIQLAESEDRKRTAYYFLITSPDGVERTYPLPAPRLTFFLPTMTGAKLNEVLPRPSRTPGAPGEFIEIYNPTDAPLDLEGCFLTDSSRNPTRWRIPAGNVAPPKGFAVFYADGANRGNHTGFRLANSGEFLGLFGRLEEGNLAIDTMAFRGLRSGESWGASPDGSKSFRAWKDPTPGGRNVPKIPEEYLRREPGEEPEPAPAIEPAPLESDGDEDDDDED